MYRARLERATWGLRYSTERAPRLRAIIDEHSTEYSLYEESRSSRPPLLRTILLAVLLGCGVHASKEVLVPSEAHLEALGMSPVLYSAITVMPVALGMVTPILWGSLWDVAPWAVPVLAALGELIGAGLNLFGLHALSIGFASAAVTCIALGLVLSSVCRAGITIAEFSICGLLGEYSALGFGSLVLAKHAMGSVVSWGVPQLLRGAGAMHGLYSVQATVLVPHAIAMCAAVNLALSHRAAERRAAAGAESSAASDAGWDDATAASRWKGKTLAATPSSNEVFPLCHGGDAPVGAPSQVLDGQPADDSWSPPASGHRRSPDAGPSDRLLLAKLYSMVRRAALQDLSLILLGLWRAFEVGTLHAYHSVRIELAMSACNASLVDAGGIFAKNDVIAMILLPLLALAAKWVGFRSSSPLLIAVPLVSLGGTVSLMLHPGSTAGLEAVATRAGLLCMSILEVGAPIIPLALLSRVREVSSSRETVGDPGAGTRRLGTAYGTVESLFITAQVMIIMLLGVVRAHAGPGDFVAPLSLMCGGFAAAAAMAYLLVSHPSADTFMASSERPGHSSHSLFACFEAV